MLLQTFIEHLRGKVEDKQEINHHGKTIEIGETNDAKSPKIINVKGSVIAVTKVLHYLQIQFRVKPGEDMYEGANEDKAYKVPKILSVNERVQREALRTYYQQ